MKRASTSDGFVRFRALVVTVLCAIGLFLGLLGSGAMQRAIDAFGLGDINLITGTETSPRVTQSTSAVWAHGNTVVVGMNDSSGGGLSPLSFCGVSTSTDGGATFTRLPEKFNTGGACYGDPSVFYSVRAGKWFMSYLSARCSTQGIAQWTSTNGVTWTNGSCVFNGTSADFHGSWVDNNPGSPFYGRQYQAFNNFNVGNGALQLVRSTDDGITWSAPSTIFSTSFRRFVKITGSFGTDGTIFVQTMDEGGGGLNGPRQNYIHRSTDGGATWSLPIAQGGTFLGPGRTTCTANSYFACMYSAPSYWRQLGWGQPGVGPGGVVHYVYSGRPSGSMDSGNIYYVRSTDNGLTWSPPSQLNTDTTTRGQWGPSLSVNSSGKMVASWYDERNTTNDSLERFARVSVDNGVSWGADMPLSDVIFPKPLQADPNIIGDYAGYYDFAAFNNDGNGDIALHAWTDGRMAINGAAQQDIFIDRISASGAPVNNIVRSGSSIVSAGANNVLDPGETVTVSLGLRNGGGPGNICTTAALTGALQASGGVTSPSGAQNYGTMCSQGPVAFRNFTFTVDPSLPCGSPVTLSLGVTDGATSYGTLTYPFITGNTATTVLENFDGVTAPALPAGWSTTFSGSGTAVTTSTVFPDTAPNDIFLSEAATMGLSEVTSAPVTITNSSQRLRFRTLYNTEPNWDGLVLEISINGAAFQDILAAGGSFASGGYTGPLSSSTSQPLPGRQAWSGLSGGTASAPAYITTLVNLPGSAVGQNVRFKWRQGSDGSQAPVTNPGSRIDSLALVSTVCGGTAPTVNSAVSRKTHGGAGTFDINLPRVPLAGAIGVECRSGAAAGEHQIVVTFASPVTMSGASVTTGAGTVASTSAAGSVVTLNLAGVTDAQRLAVTLADVASGANIGNIIIPIGILSGDANGNGIVNASDVGQVKAQSGQPIAAGTFRSDVNANGAINASDIGLVKARSGTILP